MGRVGEGPMKGEKERVAGCVHGVKPCIIPSMEEPSKVDMLSSPGSGEEKKTEELE